MSRRPRISPLNARFFAFVLSLIAVSAWAIHRYRSQAQIISFVRVTAVNAATYEEGPVAPESIAVAFGDGFTQTTVAAATTPLPTTLGGVRVQIRDSAGREQPCGLFFVSPRQINFLVPPGLTAANTTITVVTASGIPIAGPIQIASVAPGLLAANANGQGPATGFVLSVPQSGGQSYEPLAQFDQRRNRFVTLPIQLFRQTQQAEQRFLVLYGTGIHGRADLRSVTARIGGIDLPVSFAGSVPNLFGLDQINIQIGTALTAGLIGRGKVDVALSIGTATGERVFSNVLELEFADRGNASLAITGFEPTRALAGETVAINGRGFSQASIGARVRVGGVEAQVIEATAAQIKIKVPYGAETGPVAISNGAGEVISSQTLAIRTSISGVVEDTRRRPVIGVTVSAVTDLTLGGARTVASARTNSEGVFVLPDIPTDATVYLVIDGATASTTPRLPRLTLAPAIVAGRDNQVARPIALQIPNGPGIKVNTSLGFPLDFSIEVPALAPTFDNDWIQASGDAANAPEAADAQQQTCNTPPGAITFELPPGTRGTIPCDTVEECQETIRTVHVTQVENARTPVKLPAGHYSSMMAQLSPFGSSFSQGGTLTLPNSDCLTASQELRVFQLQTTVPLSLGIGGGLLPGGGAAPGQFFETGTATVSSDGQRIAISPGSFISGGGLSGVDFSGIFFVSTKRPTATIVGQVLEPAGVLLPGFTLTKELRRAVVTARGQEAITDGAGSFILRNVPVIARGDRVAVEISYLRPNGRVERALIANVSLTPNGVTTMEPVVLSAPDANRPPVILASSGLTAEENKRTDFNFTVSDADSNQTLQASMAGPSFAALIDRGGGGYTLRVTPGGEDAGAYTITLTAIDSLGATATHAINLTVVNVNQIPTATAQSVTTDEDTAKPITLTGTDPDRNALRFTVLTQPTHGKLTGEAPDLVYLPDANYFGSDSFTFKVNDGVADSRPATVAIAVAAVNDAPRLNVPGEQKVTAGQPLNFVITATDVDPADTVILSSPDLPTGATFTQTPASPGFVAQFTWTPNAVQTGVFIVPFKATDNSGAAQSVTRPVAITVLPAGAPAGAGIWSPTAGPYGGTVTALFASGSNVLAGTGNGIYRSANAGDAWTKVVTDALASAYINSFATIGNTIFAGTGAGVYRSTDNGVTWVESNQGLRVDELAVTPAVGAFAVKGSLLFAAAGGTVFASSNNGQSWSRAGNGLPTLNASITALVTNGASVFAAAVSDGIYRTTDDGRNWTRVRRSAAFEYIPVMAANAGTVYASVVGGLLGGSIGLIASADNGQTWGEAPTQPQLSFITSLLFTADMQLAGTLEALYNLRRVPNRPLEAVKILDKQSITSLAAAGATLYAGTANGVFRSTDNGANWRQINNGFSALTTYAFASVGSSAFAGTGNGVFVSSDVGRNWQPANEGLASPQGLGSSLNPITATSLASVTVSGTTRVFALLLFGGFFSSGDLGKSWQPIEGLPGFASVASMGVSGSTLFVGVRNLNLPPAAPVTVYRSLDLGRTWAPASTGLSSAVPIAFAASGANLFAISYESAFVSTNNGDNWTAINNGLPEKTTLTALAASGSNVYLGTAGKGVYVSNNNGRSWAQANTFLPRTALIGSLFAAGTNLFATVAESGLTIGLCPPGTVMIDGVCFGGINPGVSIGGGAVSARGIASQGGIGIGFGGGGGTLYFSPNQGRSWAPITAGLNDAPVSAIGANGANVFAGTAGSGVFVRQF